MSNGSSLLWAINNLGFSFFENTISLPYLFFPFKKKQNKPTGLRCTPDTCLPEKGGLAIIHRAGQLLSSHIYFSSSRNHLLALASLSCWCFSQAPLSFGHPGQGPLPTVLEAPLLKHWGCSCPFTHGRERQQWCAVQMELPHLLWCSGDWMDSRQAREGSRPFLFLEL